MGYFYFCIWETFCNVFHFVVYASECRPFFSIIIIFSIIVYIVVIVVVIIDSEMSYAYFIFLLFIILFIVVLGYPVSVAIWYIIFRSLIISLLFTGVLYNLRKSEGKAAILCCGKWFELCGFWRFSGLLRFRYLSIFLAKVYVINYLQYALKY